MDSRMAWKHGWIGLVLALAPAAAANGPAAGAAEPATVAVGGADEFSGAEFLQFFPKTIVVSAGAEVTWTSVTDTPHTVTEVPSGFDSSPAVTPTLLTAFFGPGGLLLPGRSFNFTFPTPGNWTYFCKIHPAMAGTVVVSAGAPMEPVHVAAGLGSGDVTLDRFVPQTLSVTVGTNVIWSNGHTDEPHSVTGSPANASAPPGPANPFTFDSSPALGPPPPAFEGPQGVFAKSGAARSKFNHTFSAPGHFEYVCKLHPAMRGTVVVLAADDEDEDGGRAPGLGAVALVAAVAAGLAVAARRRVSRP